MSECDYHRRLGPSPEADEAFQRRALAAADGLVKAVRAEMARKESVMVRAKFRCDEIKRQQGSAPKVGADGKTTYAPCEVRTVILSPVYGNGDPNHENTKFWQASPSGRIEIGCANLAAAEAFELGKEYYVDFTPAEEPTKA